MSSFVINKQEYIKAGGFFAGLADSGSPPLVRGKEYSPPYTSLFIRITPACAEKSQIMVLSKNGG